MSASAVAQRGGKPSRPPSAPPTGTVSGDVVRDQTRDRDRVDTPDQDRTRDQDRLRDRDPLYLGAQDRLRTFDRDRDGMIDRSEFQQWHESAFETINGNGGKDGFSLQQYQAVRLGPGPYGRGAGTRRQENQERAQLRKTERFRLMDGDGNGIVTRTEFMKFGELNYLDADANDDGKLSYGELQQFHRGG